MPTFPVSHGARLTALGDRPERVAELVGRVPEHELEAELLADAQHRMDVVLLHAGAHDEDAGVLRGHAHRLLDHAGHTDRLEDDERLGPVHLAPRLDGGRLAG